jgi:autotransporter-associated beta strand protein
MISPICSSIALAATFTYNRATSNSSATADQWSAATNWNATPPSATDTTLTFGLSTTLLPAGATLFTNNNIAGDFKLNRLNFTYSSTSLSPRPQVAISGNRLEFVNDGATAPLLNISPDGVPTPILTISNPILLTNDLTVNGTPGSDTNLAGIVSGPGKLTKTNTGNLTLSGANTYSGGTTLSAPSFVFLNNSGSAGVSSSIGTGTLIIGAPITLSNTGPGSVSISTNNAQIWASDFSFFAGTIGSTPTRSLDLGTGPVTMTANRTLNIGGNDLLGSDPTFTLGGPIGDGGSGFALTKQDNGTLILTGASTYSGGTIIAKGAINTSNIGNAGAPGLGTGNIILGTASDMVTLRYIGAGETTSKQITLGGAGIMKIARPASSTGLLKFTADLAEIGSARKTLALTTNGSAMSEFAGKITGSSIGIVVDDLGEWILSGDNTFTSNVTINSGTLSVSSLNSVAGGSPSSNLGAPTTVGGGTIFFGGLPIPGVSVHGPATLKYTGAGETTDRVIMLNGSVSGAIEQAGTGLLKFTSDVTGSGSLTFSGSSTGHGEFAGLIPGNRGVAKSGTDTWTLSAANTYTGDTRIFNGALLINGNQSAATGPVSLFHDFGGHGKLGGNGIVGGPVNINGGTITAGDLGSVATLRLNNTATFVGSIIGDDDGNVLTALATYAVDISGPTSDKLVIAGGLDLTGSLDQITFNGAPDGTSTYLLATYEFLKGAFDVGSAPPGYQLIYGATELTLAPVPEPSVLTLVALAAAALLARTRRASKRSLSSY